MVTLADRCLPFSMPIEPGELLMFGVLVKQHAGTRNGKAGLQPASLAELRNKNGSFATEFKTTRIERLRHQSAVVHEQQGRAVPAENWSVCCRGIGAQEHFRAGGV